MQNDGNFCVYKGSGPDDKHEPIWCSMKYPGAGQYFAIMQNDGNFCVYKGSGPDDKREPIWCSMKYPGAGQYFAIMQNDGNFCVYKGSGPDDKREPIWCSMVYIADIPEIISIDYDINAAVILQSGPAELYRQTVKNNTDEPQSNTIGGSASLTETSGWSNAVAVTFNSSATFKTGIPIIANAEVQLSLSVSDTYTWEGSISKTKTWEFSTPVSVPPRMTIVCLVYASVSTIAVPYTLKGIARLNSGIRLPVQIKGIYTGTNSHDLSVTFIQQDPITLKIASTVQKITNVTSKV
jgi:hypothetical protein